MLFIIFYQRYYRKENGKKQMSENNITNKEFVQILKNISISLTEIINNTDDTDDMIKN